MKTIKSLILGSAAGLLAMGGAQAADLPVKAKAVEYVRICSLYGAGFYYIPGTDTCIKLGGYVRVDLAVNGGDYNPYLNGAGGAKNRLSNYYNTRARTDLTIDTRTATEYGVVRAYGDLVFSVDSNSVTNSGTGGTAFGSFNTTGGPGSGGAGLGMYHAFIQFAGFTIGRTYSIFDTPWQSYPAGGPDTLPGGSNHVTGVNQINYTADFGQGVTASIGLDEMTTMANGQTNLYNLSAAAATGAATGAWGANDWGGTRVPDIVGAIRVDQAWGLAQLSVAAHDMHAAYYGTAATGALGEANGHPADKWGFAIQAGLSIKNIPTGPGDTINMNAVYTDGATKYNFQSLMPSSYAIYGGTNLAGAYQSVAVASLADGTFTTGSGIESVKTWGFRGGYTHNWNANWASSIYGSYAQLKYGNNAKATIGTAFNTATATINPDFNLSVIGVGTVWTPVKGLAFSGDVNVTWLDQKSAGTISGANTAVAGIAKPAATYEFKDQMGVSALFRAQRNF
jgi:hypothetical protein